MGSWFVVLGGGLFFRWRLILIKSVSWGLLFEFTLSVERQFYGNSLLLCGC